MVYIFAQLLLLTERARLEEAFEELILLLGLKYVYWATSQIDRRLLNPAVSCPHVLLGGQE